MVGVKVTGLVDLLTEKHRAVWARGDHSCSRRHGVKDFCAYGKIPQQSMFACTVHLAART